MRKAGVDADRWWRLRPEEMAERDRAFFAGRDGHNTWPELARFTCQAVVRGRRCNRIAISETGHRHCIKHAGPARARLYRENQRKLFECGRLPAATWFKDEARRTRTAIRDRQRRKRGGWALPGVTLRLSEPIEQRFRADLQPLLPHLWSVIPDFHRDQLRWAWRRFMLDRQKPEAWNAKARAILLDLKSRRLPQGAELAHATGFEPHVLACERRAAAFEWRSRLPQAEIDRAIQASVTVRKAIAARIVARIEADENDTAHTPASRAGSRAPRRCTEDQRRAVATSRPRPAPRSDPGR
jgi:hypothetical protein